MVLCPLLCGRAVMKMRSGWPRVPCRQKVPRALAEAGSEPRLSAAAGPSRRVRHLRICSQGAGREQNSLVQILIRRRPRS